jgi:Nucleoside-diphosphate-sugar epimerases
MRVLVTGATGFIGAQVTARLLELGCEVTALFRDEARLAAQPWRARVRPLRMDIAQADEAELDRLAGHDRVLHLAWGGLNAYRSSEHTDTLFPQHLAFLRGLLARGVPRLLVTGTCLEYGLQEGALAEDSPCLPVTAYGQAKDQLRRALEPDCAAAGTELVWARLFYTYGPGQSEKSLLSQLDRAIASHADVFDMSGGEQERDYLPVERIAELLAFLALAPCAPGIYNVASGRPITVRALVEQTLRRRGSALRLNLGHYPYPDYEPMRFWADTARLERALGQAQPGAVTPEPLHAVQATQAKVRT